MSWTDEEREQAISKYKDAEPTPENSMDIVNEIAEEMDKTANGVRMILMKADVYVNKVPQSTAASSKSSGGSKRVSKEEAHSALSGAIEGLGLEPDMDIISKLTGKAAIYIADVINKSHDND